MLTAAALMCHAPIVIPAIGGARGADCRPTTEAMSAAAAYVVASGARLVVLLSPHLPRPVRAAGLVDDATCQGDFGAFGHQGVGVSCPASRQAVEALQRAAARNGVAIENLHPRGLDHGSLVPLWFLRQAGFKGQVAVLGFPMDPLEGLHADLGHAIRHALDDLDTPWALVVSGDMSHALRPGSPGGYHPRARQFDEAVTARVASGNLAALTDIPPDLRELAREDVMDSLLTAEGVRSGEPWQGRVLSYQGPFGVGYLVALLQEAS